MDSSSNIVVSTFVMNFDGVVDFLKPKLAHLHIPFEDIIYVTYTFADDNLIKRGSIADVYRGKIFQSEEWVDVVIRRFLPWLQLLEYEFLREIATLTHLNHRNIKSIVGFRNENGEKIMVFEHEDKGSLSRYLSDPTLTWSQRLKICLDAARALNYIHKDIEGCLSEGSHPPLLTFAI